MDKATNLLTLCYRHCATNLSHQFTDPLRPPVIFELCLEIRRQVVQQAVDVKQLSGMNSEMILVKSIYRSRIARVSWISLV